MPVCIVLERQVEHVALIDVEVPEGFAARRHGQAHVQCPPAFPQATPAGQEHHALADHVRHGPTSCWELLDQQLVSMDSVSLHPDG